MAKCKLQQCGCNVTLQEGKRNSGWVCSTGMLGTSQGTRAYGAFPKGPAREFVKGSGREMGIVTRSRVRPRRLPAVIRADGTLPCVYLYTQRLAASV